MSEQPGIIASLSGPAYQAANPISQELINWHPTLSHPDAELLPSRDKIVSRSRDLVRNDGWAAGATTRYLDAVIGADLRLSSKPNWRALGLDPEWAREFAQELETQWRMVAYDPDRYCDTARYHTMGGLFALAFRQQFVDGDAIALSHWLPERGGRFATAIQIVDSDRLSNPAGVPDSTDIRGGIELDAFGAATYYNFRKGHPGNNLMLDPGIFEWIRVPRETPHGRRRVIHCYDKHRPDATRGTGRLTPVVNRLKMLTKYDQTELQAAVINSVLAAYLKSPFDQTLLTQIFEDPALGGGVGDYQAVRKEYHNKNAVRLDGARIPVLFPGEELGMLQSNHPTSNFAAFESATLRNIAAGIGLSYEQLSADWSQVNYSSARAALVEVYRTFARDRENFAQTFCTGILALYVEEFIEKKLLPLPVNSPGFFENKAAYCAARWIGPPRGWIDPLKEVQASEKRVALGFSTLEDEMAEQGRDFEETVERIAREREKLQSLGLEHPSQQKNPSVAQPRASKKRDHSS